MLTQNNLYVLLRLPGIPMEIASCLQGIMVLDGYGSSGTSQYIRKFNCNFFSQSKVVLKTIACGEILVDMSFLTINVLIHNTAKYTMLAMINLSSYLKVMSRGNHGPSNTATCRI